MKASKMLGAAMIAMLFAALFAVIAYRHGAKFALLVFGTTGFVAAWVLVASYLIFGGKK